MESVKEAVKGLIGLHKKTPSTKGKETKPTKQTPPKPGFTLKPAVNLPTEKPRTMLT